MDPLKVLAVHRASMECMECLPGEMSPPLKPQCDLPVLGYFIYKMGSKEPLTS